jgi:hypothetical protein
MGYDSLTKGSDLGQSTLAHVSYAQQYVGKC